MPKVVARAGLAALVVLGTLLGPAGAAPQGGTQLVTPTTIDTLTAELATKYGESERPRIERGVRQAAQFWRREDGDEAAFAEVVRAQVVADSTSKNALFSRMEFAFESLDGHMNEISRDFRRQSDLDIGEIYPFDEILAGYDPSAHVNDDFFANRLAFAVLLNFPLTTLPQRLTEGETWSRRQWAEARLAERFGKRVPADVNLAIAEASSDAARYIARYNIWTHHLVDAKGQRLFPAKQRLLSHWNLRDQIKADYADKAGLPRQRVIAMVCDRIVTQTIPALVVDNPHVDWDPATNAVALSKEKDSDAATPLDMKISNAPEPDTRYATLLETYQAARKADPYSPTAPTLIARRFDENRQIPEAQVRAMLEEVLSSPFVPRVAALIEGRLGRPLEPFDVWYNGFRPRGAHTEEELDAIVRKRYPTAEAYEQDIPNLLYQLGFSKERAQYLAAHIVVDPARGSGHALGAQRRADKAHLRTRVEKEGMNYKGFNIAVHEMGHNVEQTFSLNDIDSTLLQGVPNTAFTEALAFVFQAHDLELLGLAKADPKSQALKTLNDFWMTYEIAGVALVDMGVWHWMYDHPGATPAQLKDATLQICRDLWNRYYAPVFKKKDVVLTLGIYSHMIDSFLYLPDYPIGHLIAFQIEQQMEKARNVGSEFERMAKIGNVAPDIWMKQATGAPVGPHALLSATEKALAVVTK
ncbi:MAG TPA: hypothetical protein VN032_08215 [Thermoanaerobaculia bacterium]|jgi:hypothetical protein|nr:hypothetical protein [Thermoanaerobaculia bacterium]